MFYSNRLPKTKIMVKSFLRSKRFYSGIVFIISWLGFFMTGEKTLQQIIGSPDFILGIELLIGWLVSLNSGEVVAFGGRNIWGKKL